jgi:hypothetical protein
LVTTCSQLKEACFFKRCSGQDNDNRETETNC